MIMMMIMILMTMMIIMTHDDDYDDDFHYDDDDYDDGMLGSMVQVVEAATNNTACIPASAAPRGYATNPRTPTLRAQFSAV